MNYNEFPNLTKLNISELNILYQSTSNPGVKSAIGTAMTAIQESNYQQEKRIKEQLEAMGRSKTLKEQVEAMLKLTTK